MKWPLRFSPEARVDLRNLTFYLRDEAGPRAAAKYARDISHRLERLRTTPKAGVLLPDYGAHVRFVPCRRHIIYFELQQRTVVILRVLHALQDRDAIMRGRG